MFLNLQQDQDVLVRILLKAMLCQCQQSRHIKRSSQSFYKQILYTLFACYVHRSYEAICYQISNQIHHRILNYKNKANLRMQHRQRINKMFQTGRFQCDYEFYKNLLQWLRALDLYEYEEKVKKNIQIVANIVKLTQKHSDSLAENYDQEKAMNTTKVIHQQIRKINIQATKQIINACNSMNQESYRTKVRNLINNYNQHGKQYAQICTRIWKNVNSEQLRINNLILVVFYMVKNKENLQRNIQTYQKVIQRGMQALKQFPQNFKFIQSHSQIANHKKVHEYLSGTLVISVVLLRFNNVAKVIQGKSSNLTLKLTSLKHTIDNCLSEYPEIALQNIQQEQIPLEAFKSLLRGNKQNSKLINECCNWCLKPGSDLDGKHKICQNIIDLYAQ